MSAGSLVLGLVSGLTVGLLAVGLVLVYRANRFLNVAHAQLGVFSALLLSKFVIDWGWNWWAAFVVCVPVGVVLAVAVFRLLIRPLQAKTSSTIVLLLASIGVTQLLLTGNFVPALGADAATFQAAGGFPLPFEAELRVAGVVLHADGILTLVAVPMLVGALVLVLRVSTFGKQIRAAATNPDAARLCGIPVDRVSTFVWAIAGAMSALSAILVARSVGAGSSTSLGGTVDGFGPDLLLLSLGAAAFGGFRSIFLALAGSLVLGLAQQVTLDITSSAGDASLVVFGLILVVVLVQGRRIASAFSGVSALVDDQQPLRIPPGVARHALVRHRVSLLAGASLLLGIAAPLLPYFRTEPHRYLLVMVLVFALVSVSLTIVIGWGGQVSLGQMAVVGAGAFVTGRFAPDGTTVPVLLVLSGAVGAALMLVVGLPALRIRGLTLGVTTLGLAVVAPVWLFQKEFFGSGQSFGLLIEQRPALAVGLGRPESMLALYYVALAVLAIALAGAHGVRRSRAGRLFIAVRDNERAAESFGIGPATVKLSVLAVSGFIAGTAGTIHALAWSQVSTQQFPAALSLSVLAAPVVGGLGSLTGAVVGAVALYSPVYFLAPHLIGLFGRSGVLTGFQLLLAGLTLPIVLLAYPTGIVGAGRRGVQRVLERLANARTSAAAVGVDVPLEVEDTFVDFGGIRALDGASIRVRRGEIVGLIGPNGAGKSTLINVISGVYRPDAGSVRVHGREVVALPASYRAACGLGRTFQDAQLFPGLTVTEVIQVALNRRFRPGLLTSGMWAPWARLSERRSRAAALEVIERFGLAPWQDSLASDLSTGTRRICDLAAQVAMGARVLLLDEPTGGVAQREAEAFGPLLRRIRDELDCSIVIVEHDMPLLMGLCDRVYAMELGRVIAEGTPAEIRTDPAVIASYLGTDEVAIARSGTAVRAPNDRKAAAAARGEARR